MGRNEHSLKVVVLAAPRSVDGASFPFLSPLGESKVIDYSLGLALRLAQGDDLYLVVGPEGDDIAEHLHRTYPEASFQIIRQAAPRGTGDAVLQLAPALVGYTGDLLILYGDTPLLRRTTISGLLNHHRLKQADLTLLIAQVPDPGGYGRIIRDGSGRIVDIVEAEEAVGDVRAIREVNAGATVARAPALYTALAQLATAETKAPLRLTDTVHRMLHTGGRMAAFCTYDADEILGVNTPADQAIAEFALQKRFFHPWRAEERSEIRFGTGGWRAVIGEGFTMHNVRRLCQALANHALYQNQERAGVLIGYDRRFLSDRAAAVAAEIFAANNLPVQLLTEPTPTPLVTYATAFQQCALGLVFTASHNPPEWNGLKVFHQDGSLLMADETDRIEAEANRLGVDDVVKIDLGLALTAQMVRYVDYTNEYVDAVENHIDLAAIRAAALRVVIDPMYGVGQATLETVLTEARCRVTTIRGRHDPLFGGHSPAPDLQALSLLINTVREGRYHLGLATDGDADRIAIVDETGQFVPVNEVLLLLYYYLRRYRGETGGVVRNLATTHLLDRLALHFGEAAYETPVGFKDIVAAMQTHNALLGGESSGGLTIRGHILGKDGIFAAALFVEMLAVTGRTISQLLDEIYRLVGRLHTLEVNLEITSEMKLLLPRRLAEQKITAIGSYPVRQVSHADGTKVVLDNDNWLLLRFSGTEPLLRIFAEADTPAKAQELVQWARALLPGEPQGA
ncbi:MAG: NTP transferase domain-containing protein [Caldilineaceae bacterium]|nr:NTP transferase domain-containing protein [Caldilineaceae bacterium]